MVTCQEDTGANPKGPHWSILGQSGHHPGSMLIQVTESMWLKTKPFLTAESHWERHKEQWNWNVTTMGDECNRSWNSGPLLPQRGTWCSDPPVHGALLTKEMSRQSIISGFSRRM